MSLDSRSRMISFRISHQEYEKFRDLCFTSGTRSVSELARVAINSLLTKPPAAATHDSLDLRVSQLEARLHQVSLELKSLQHKPNP